MKEFMFRPLLEFVYTDTTHLFLFPLNLYALIAAEFLFLAITAFALDLSF